MPQVSLLRGSRLAFPSRGPGFNPSHPAAGSVNFSSIPTLGNFVRLDSSAIGTLGGTVPSSIDSVLGPVDTFSGTLVVSFSFPVARAQFTTACFLRLSGTTGVGTRVIFNGNDGILLASGTNVVNLVINNGGSLGVGAIALTVGVPYFIVASYTTGAQTLLVLNLNSGVVQTATGTTATVLSGNASTIFLGNNGAFNRPLLGNLGPAMWSNVFTSLPAALLWAADPWAFWYPRSVLYSLDWLAAPGQQPVVTPFMTAGAPLIFI